MIVLALVGVAVFGAVASLAYLALVASEERALVRASLRSLEGYDVERLRDVELERPLGERLAQPIRRLLGELGRRVVPIGYLERVRHKLVVAGGGSAEELDRFRALRVLTLALLPVGVVAALALVPPPAEQQWAAAVFVALLLALGPDAALNRRVAERQQVMRQALPDVLDLLTITVEAGAGFEQALERSARAVPGPLSEEFARMLGEVRAGAGRTDALRHLDERTDVPEIRSFVLALIQAETLGVSVARVLRAQAEEMRVRRRQLAQERAQKAQVKMLLPMVLCIFPALFVVLLAPAVLMAAGGL